MLVSSPLRFSISALRQYDSLATSIALNIGEGAGEFSKPDKARFYRYARRSATESAAALDVAVAAQCQAGRETLIRIVSMLTNMVRALER